GDRRRRHDADRGAAGRGERGREDQRAAVPVVQGDHGGEEEAGHHADACRRRDRPVRGGAGQRAHVRDVVAAQAAEERRARSTTAPMTDATASTSAAVEVWPRENRSEPRAVASSAPIASSTWL